MSEQLNDWWDDEELWDAFAPMLFSAERWGGTPGEIDGVLALAPTPGGAAVLDLACGVGRHSLELTRRGFRVTGVDYSQRLLTEARQRGAKAGVELELVQEDMRSFLRPGAFDLAVNLFTSFGFYADDRDNRRVLENVFASLRPGGAFLMDILGREVLARRFRPRDWKRLPDGSMFLQERTLVDGWREIDNTWTLISDRGTQAFRIRHFLYGACELRDMFEAAGFTSVKFYGGLDGSPYDHEAQRLVIVGRA